MKFGIKPKDRRQHMYVIGQTGTGKSTLLKNMAIRDMRDGHGVCVIDPHGELVEDILNFVPEIERTMLYISILRTPKILSA